MHIVFATTEYNYDGKKAGGLAAYLVKISQLLIERGHRVSICTLAAEQRVLVENNVTVYELRERMHPLFMLASALTAFQLHKGLLWKSKSYEMLDLLKKVHKKDTIDIIQYSSTYGLSYYSPKKIPFCVRNSGMLYICNEAEDISNKGEKQKEAIQLAAVLRAQHVFGPSLTTNNRLLEDYNKVSTLIKTPATASVHPNSKTKQRVIKEPYLLFFGTLNAIKGVQFIGPILEKFLKQHPRFQFVFAGGDAIMNGIPSSEYIIKSAGQYSDRCIYLGLIPKEEVYPLIKQSYAVVIPSLIDNSPNTVMEAMAFGKVVLSSMDGSIREMIIDGYNGYNVDVEDTDLFLAALNKLCSLSVEEINRLQNNTLKKVEEHNPQKISNQVELYYLNIIERWNAS